METGYERRGAPPTGSSIWLNAGGDGDFTATGISEPVRQVVIHSKERYVVCCYLQVHDITQELRMSV